MFSVGDKIVYPMHGAGVIESIEEREILGEKDKYYTIKMPIGNLKISIPLKKVQEIGLRDVADTEKYDEAIEVLAMDEVNMPDNWNERYKANLEKIKTGDILNVAEVVRNLISREKEKGLSSAEKKMLSNAKKILVSEIILVRDIEKEEAEEIILGSIC